MSLSLDPSLRTLNECGCCKGISAATPVQISNRPGLQAIMYRIGTHAQFKETMLARLSGSRLPALSTLTTRENADFSIALLDAWATVADVLTFYQERIAHEAYLRTATERASVLELARLIGYELRPGVAASTYLAFTLEDTPGALGQALSIGTSPNILESLPPISIDVGTKVQSIPGPGEQAVTFETVEKIEARAEWNAIKPRLARPQSVSITATFIIFQGTATNLKQGDTLLIVKNGNAPSLKILNVADVTVNEAAKTTRVDFVSPPSPLPGYERPQGLQEGSLNDFPSKVELDDAVVQQIAAKTWSEADLSALIEVQGWPEPSLAANLARQTAQQALPQGSGVFAFRQRAAIFGYNAPKQPDYKKKDGTFVVKPPSKWTEWPLEGEAENKVFLDNAYDAILPKSYVAMAKPDNASEIFTIDQVAQRPRTDYGLSAKTTLLTLPQGQSWWKLFPANKPATLCDFRDITIYAQSEPLALADLPIDDPVEGNTITLDRAYLGLKAGRRVILTGERRDLAGIMASEAMILKKVIIEAGFTVLTFEQSLAYNYLRQTVTINCNVAPATHGETVQETLGGGDAGKSFQRFSLRQPPLTYVSAATPAGAQTTLEVRVNDILWHEVPSLLSHGPEERVYVTRIDDAGKSTVIFGDGTTGTRLPTGQENVAAHYRKGIGLPGLVKANQLTQLMTRPLGVKGVANPSAATGAADREQLDDARGNAPLTVLTLDRVVSLQDYEDFARSFSGISKALATWTWSGEKREVFVTIAGVKGAEVKADSTLYENLLKAMREAGNPTVSLVLQSYQPRFFRLSAGIKVDADYLPEKVMAAVEQRLRDSFSFEARAFGQPVNLSEVMAVIHSVTGLVAVDVKQFYRSDQPAPVNIPPRLAAAMPRPGERQVFPPELLMLDARPLGLEVLP
jgi:predicted phage baseplate assembly protein